jgi:two-component system, NarL family, response regulator DesR
VSARVLVVDDDATIRRLLVLLLGRDDRYSVVAEAGDGEEALGLIAAHDPDLVLLDLAMPRLDGLQVIAALDARMRSRVAVLTGFADPSLHAQVLTAGAGACLLKGRDFARIGDRLWEVRVASQSTSGALVMRRESAEGA